MESARVVRVERRPQPTNWIVSMDAVIADREKLPGAVSSWQDPSRPRAEGVRPARSFTSDIRTRVMFAPRRRWPLAYLVTLAVAATMALLAPSVRAHAVVVGSSLPQSPVKSRTAIKVVLNFSSTVEVGLSRVFLVSKGDVQQRLAIQAGGKPGDLVVDVPALGAGDYALKYKVFASDGHLTEDVIRFRVAD